MSEYPRIDALANSAAGKLTARVVTWLATALLALSLYMAKGELSGVHSALAAQTTGLEKLQAKLSTMENRLVELSEKMARAEEKYAAQVPTLAERVAELDRRLDQMITERDMRLERWSAAMRQHEAALRSGPDDLVDELLRRLLPRRRSKR